MSLPSTKQVIAISQSSTTNAATASGNIDTLGYKFLSIDVITSTSNAVSNKPTVLKLSQSDTTVVSTFADISGAVGGSDFTIADAVTSGDWGSKFNVSLVGKKRYIKISVSPLTTQIITAIANLSKGDVSPASATEVNVKNVINV